MIAYFFTSESCASFESSLNSIEY